MKQKTFPQPQLTDPDQLLSPPAKSLFPQPPLLKAWTCLLGVYLISFGLSFALGSLLIRFFRVAPEALFEVSTKRLSFAFPVMQKAASMGLDEGLILFVWNSVAALITISFLYTASLFNPQDLSNPPRTLRKVFSGRRRMKLLCFLPGCRTYEEESLRRLYVWLMIPWLGMLLLGGESGLIVSTSASVFGSTLIGLFSLLPHGIVEIPAFTFAGALSFSAHRLIKGRAWGEQTEDIFKHLNSYQKSIPLPKVLLLVLCGLFVAGLLEAHLTPQLTAVLEGI